ncbi:MAG: hypothetical protein ABJO54_07365 [Hyphomicrobiales bacterium]
MPTKQSAVRTVVVRAVSGAEAAVVAVAVLAAVGIAVASGGGTTVPAFG